MNLNQPFKRSFLKLNNFKIKMGNYLRKYEVEKKDDFDATPKKSERFTCDDNDLTMDEFSDPRSPNNEIFRTPLSVSIEIEV